MSTSSENSVSAPALGPALVLASLSVSALVSIGIALFLNWGR